MGLFDSARGITPETEKLADRGYYGRATDTAEDARRVNQQTAQSAGNAAYWQGQNAAGARGEQTSALGLLRRAAEGTAPSRAEMFGRQQMDQAASGQQSLAASARGPAALAMAQQQAAGNTARAQTDITNSSMQMRADEMARARGEYMQGATGIRGQDMGAQQMEYGRQAQADAAQRGWAGQGLGIEQQQIGKDQADRQDYWNFYNAASGNDQRQSQSNSDTMKGIGSAALGAAMFMSDVRTKENVRGINPNAMEEYLATLTPASYQYNGVGGTPAASQQVGPASAQAIAGTQVGQSVVEQRPDGLLSISAPGAIKAGMAADAHINDKASRAEAKADAALRMQANQYADPVTAALMGMGPKKADGPGLASLTTAPTVVSAQPKRDWLMDELARINATNNVKGPR